MNLMSKIKPLNAHEKQDMITAIDSAIAHTNNAIALIQARSTIAALAEDSKCNACFYMKGMLCEKWQAEVPADWRERGCDEFIDDDEIPF